ncbi:hypothetical protein [Aeromonas veronii]|uniref:hypothetical protein n=1 Tax=Aeromonas TaxID=642 RepID=UPI0038D292E4
MIAKEITDFLLPDIADPIQVTFMCILLLMIFSTIISTLLVAKPSSWEKKWRQGTPDDDSDDLDIEHGSVTDLWHAVATTPEKVAEIMPSMLLVVGLLGTFLGLGLALNHASNILGQPDAMSASGAANSMHDLLGLLQGLGTKFKTSTWGICGFVLLKITSEFTRLDEKRLTWVIQRVKVQLNQRKQHCVDNERYKQQQLFDQMQNITNGVVDGLTKNVALLLEQSKNQHILYEKEFQSFNTHIMELNSSNQEIGASLNRAINAQSLTLGKNLQDIHNGVKGHQDILQQTLQAQTSTLSEYLQSIQTSTNDTMDAMKHFTKGTEVIVNNMASTADKMATGADRVGGAAVELVDAVGLFKTQFTDVLNNVRHDLGAAITNMSAQASNTLERGSQQLGDATREISSALAQLSDDVKGTMDAVQDSITKALEIQQKSQAAFTVSTMTLTEKIDASTGVVQAMATPIEAGLRAISASNRHLTTVGETIDESNSNLKSVIEALMELPDSFAPLKKIADGLSKIENATVLLKHIEENVGQLPHNLKPIKQLDSVLPQFKAILSSLNDLRTDLEPIHLLADNTGKAASNTQIIATVSDNTNAMLHVLKELRNDIHVATRHEAAPEMAN